MIAGTFYSLVHKEVSRAASEYRTDGTSGGLDRAHRDPDRLDDIPRERRSTSSPGHRLGCHAHLGPRSWAVPGGRSAGARTGEPSDAPRSVRRRFRHPDRSADGVEFRRSVRRSRRVFLVRIAALLDRMRGGPEGQRHGLLRDLPLSVGEAGERDLQRFCRLRRHLGGATWKP